MQTIQVGFSRLYDAGICELLGGENVQFNFLLDNVSVEAYIGHRPKHSMVSFDPKSHGRSYTMPTNETMRLTGRIALARTLHPADLFVELIASQKASVDDALAESFYAKESEARSAVLRIAEGQKTLFDRSLDYVAGVLGLRLNYQFINKPIDSQCFAYRRKGEQYSLSVPLHITTVEPYTLDLSEVTKPAFRRRFPLPAAGWAWQDSSEVLAWLLRAWSASDPIQRFVALFIPLECVIPAIPKKELNESEWGKKRTALLDLAKTHPDKAQRKALSRMIKGTLVNPPLFERFKSWATEATLPGWKSDIAAFKRFYQMRNRLVHQGTSEVELKVTLEPEDVRSLEDITERYVSLALFGEADVYQSAVRPK